MAINGSQKNDEKDPWRRGTDGPPDLVQLLKKFFNKLTQASKNNTGYSMPPVKNAMSLLGLVLGVIFVLWFLSGIFVVSPPEQAVELRLGKYLQTVGPGPHWIPRFIDSKYVVNVQKIDSFPYQSEMLTKDENIVSVKLQVQYRIADLRDYLFNVVGPVSTLQQAVSSALRQVVGQMKLDPILTTGREQLTQQVKQQLNGILKLYQTGMEVRDVALQAAKPPDAVTEAFDDVVKAREDKQSYINKAFAYSKKRVLDAQGRAARLTQEANAYKYTVVAYATGETARYLALLKPYKEQPEITRERLYLDTITTVLSKTSNIIVDSSAGNNMLYLPLNELLQRREVSASVPSPTTNATTTAKRADTNSSSSLEDQAIDGSSLYPDRPAYSDGGPH